MSAPTQTRAASTLGVVLALLVALVTVPATKASAHGDSLRLRAVLDRVTPDHPEIAVSLTDGGAGAVVLRVDGATVVEVLDPIGLAFLRIGDGRVEADVASSAWAASNDPEGRVAPPSGPLPDPDWRVVADEATWTWFDHRLHPDGIAVPDEIVAAGIEADLRAFAIPLRVRAPDAPESVDGAFSGRIVFAPPTGVYRAAVDVERTDLPDGVDVAVLDGRVPGLFLQVTRPDTVVTVLGEQGEPFLRVDETGAAANVRSPTWQRTAQVSSAHAVPFDVDASAPPRWQPLAAGRNIGWLDLRLHSGTLDAPAGASPAEPTTVGTWTIGVTTAAQDPTSSAGAGVHQIVGTTTWFPQVGESADGSDAPIGAEAIATAIAVMVGLVLVSLSARRRIRAAR